MYKLNFDKLVKNYIKKIKCRQIKRKVELLDRILLFFLGFTFIGVIVSLILNKEIIAFLLDLIMLIEVYILWFRNKNYDDKHSKIIKTMEKENIKVRRICLGECLLEKSIDINNERLLSLVLNEFNSYLLKNKSLSDKYRDFCTSFILPIMIAFVGFLDKDIYQSLFFLILVCLFTAYITRLGLFVIKGLCNKDYYTNEIHDILLYMKLEYIKDCKN